MEDKILRALKKVIDPELGINIVDLGLIYKVGQKDGVANILMTLTSPGCPLAGTFREQVMDVVMKTKEVKKVKVKLTFNPPWTPDKISKKGKLELGTYF